MLLKKIIVFLFVKIISPKVKVKYCEESFSFCFKNNILEYNFHTEDMGFTRHMREYHLYEPQFKLLLYSLLHEIGHYYTQDCIDEEELETRALCSLIPFEVIMKRKDLQNEYFNLKSEFEATEWAIGFAVRHSLFCRVFDSLL